MALILILTWILENAGNADAIQLWAWFGHHIFLTILLAVLFA